MGRKVMAPEGPVFHQATAAANFSVITQRNLLFLRVWG